MRQVVPLAGVMGIRVEALSETRSQLSMPHRPRVKNHLGDIYFGAEMTLMELAMGVLLFRRFPMREYGFLVKRVESDFRARAKGHARAVCEPPVELFATLEGALRQKGDKVEEWIAAKLLAEDDSVICEARFLAAIKRY